MKIFLFIFVFFAIGFLLIISNNGLALYDSDNFKIFIDMSSNWVDDVYSNFISLTGNVVGRSWFPE